jgi:putative two-component system response regulator
MIEARDGYGAGHCHRMANFAASVGRALQVPDAAIRTLYRGAFLHDIGMLAISDSVLRKQGPLTDDEYEHVKAHTVLGDTLCMNLRSLRPIRPILRWHHERIDGSGYPDGLQGDQIPLVAQIVGVVDVYEAVTTTRPYQPVHSPADAIAVLRRGVERGALAGTIVEAFVATLEARKDSRDAAE